MTAVKETEVEAAFARYLFERGWDVDTDKLDHADVVASRGAKHLVAEVKGTTTSPGLDVDTAYGQLLRRMGDRPRRHPIRDRCA
jgi:Holliday junction resolvase